MNYFEAMASFLLFLLILGSFIHTCNNLIAKAADAKNYYEAKIQAEKCDALIDSFYSNSGGRFKELKTDCFVVGGNKIGSKSEEMEAEAAVLNRKTKLIQIGERTNLIVEVIPHYG